MPGEEFSGGPWVSTKGNTEISIILNANTKRDLTELDILFHRYRLCSQYANSALLAFQMVDYRTMLPVLCEPSLTKMSEPILIKNFFEIPWWSSG